MRDGLNFRHATLAVLLLLGAPLMDGWVREAAAQNLSVKGFDTPACEGDISTFPLEKIPTKAFYWLDIFDETEQTLAFQKIFLQTLRDNGHVTNRDGRLVFNLESQSSFLGLVPAGGIDQAQLNAGRERDPGRDVGIGKLRDTIRESRGGYRQGRTPLGQQLDVKAELRDAENGKVLWLATLNCRPLTSDRKVLTEFISGVLVESLSRGSGQSTF